MSLPTSLPGQVTQTSPYGRDVNHCGWPIKVCELLSTLEGPEYVARVAVNNVKNVKAAGKAIRKAFQNQVEKKGFSLVEVVSACPTNWGMTPQKALEWVESDMLPYYPVHVDLPAGDHRVHVLLQAGQVHGDEHVRMGDDKTVLVTFQRKVAEALQERFPVETVSTVSACVKIPVYRFSCQGQAVRGIQKLIDLFPPELPGGHDGGALHLHRAAALRPALCHFSGRLPVDGARIWRPARTGTGRGPGPCSPPWPGS